MSESGTPGDSAVCRETREAGSAGRFIELGAMAMPGIRVTSRKRSPEAAFGTPPLQESASKRSRAGGDKQTTSASENNSVLPAPVSTPLASTPIRYRAPAAYPSTPTVNAGIAAMLVLLEKALSEDDDVAKRATRKFLYLPLEPGVKIANFIEGLKVLVLHAGLRTTPLPGISADDIFQKGVSRLKTAAMGTVEPRRCGDRGKLMLGQVKKMLFAPGTPREFIRLGDSYRQDKPDADQSRQQKHTCYYALKEMGVLTEIKSAIKRDTSPESALSCQERIEAMWLRLHEADVAQPGFPAQPDYASLALAGLPRAHGIARQDSGKQPFEEMLAEYILRPQADVMAFDNDHIVMAEIAPVPACPGRTENTTTTTTTTTTTPTADFTAAIAARPVAAAMAQAEAAITLMPPAGGRAPDGIHPAPQAPVARDARSLFSLESIVNKRF